MKKIISVLLALVTVFASVAIYGCSKDQEEMLTVLEKGGEPAYVIYRPDKASEETREGGSTLRDLINEITGVRFQYSTDDQFGKIEGKKEIAFGNTNREITSVASADLGENQFRFLAVGDSIAIVASNDSLLELAAQTFVDEYVTEDGIKVPVNLDRTWQCEPSFSTYKVKNPILDGGSDPYVTELNGTYYYCWSGGNGVYVSSAPSLDKITEQGGVKVYTAPGGTMYSGEYWAPELHYVQGEWYIYVAADDGENVNHRMYVLKGTSQDPTKPFTFVGKITDPSDNWAIDGTILYVNDEMYFVWSGWENETSGDTQNLYIAHMSDPCTIDSERVLISSPQYGWEIPINEGPIAVYNNGETYIIYSGNKSWEGNYCLAYLKLTGSDPLKKNSWEKSPNPILSRGSAANGPGHCSVATAPDGSQWIIYHANLPEKPVGWDGRSVWIQKLQFSDNGGIKLMRSAKSVDFPESSWVITEEITN